MQATYDIAPLTRRMAYRVTDQVITVEAEDTWSENIIEKFFAGWYLTPEALTEERQTPAIVIRRKAQSVSVSRDWQQFEIAGGGTCRTDGKTSYIDIEGSTVAIGAPAYAAVEIWIDGTPEIHSPALTRVVTYALSAALRQRRLFELHSAAVIDPESSEGLGLLIIGPSGSGKSTLTVQLATAGWSFLTDDVLLLSNEGAEVKAWPLRRCFAITSGTFAASSFLQERTSLDYLKAQRDDKKQFVPHGVFAAEFKENCLPRRLFFTEISDSEVSSVRQLSAGETMSRLIRISPWSCYDRTTAAAHLAVLASLVRQSRGYALRAGRDLLEADAAAALIARYTRN